MITTLLFSKSGRDLLCAMSHRQGITHLTFDDPFGRKSRRARDQNPGFDFAAPRPLVDPGQTGN